MATSSVTSPVTRETPALVFDRGTRRIIVTIRDGLIELRAKGLRTTEAVDIASLYTRAVKERVIFERTQRRKARKVK
jgi:hypothetical protein